MLQQLQAIFGFVSGSSLDLFQRLNHKILGQATAFLRDTRIWQHQSSRYKQKKQES
jgi:hypothetical protein